LPDKKTYKFDIFDILKRISLKSRSFSEEEEKAMQPIVIMRWLSGTKSERQIYLLNQTVNKYIFDFYHHKQLLINLMSISTNGKYQKYNWLKRTKEAPKTKHMITVVSEYYNYSSRRCSEVLPILDDDTFIELANDLGKTKEFIRDLKKELKTR